MTSRSTLRGDAGSALLLVLWISLFLALLLASVAALVQSRVRIAGSVRAALVADETMLSALDVAAFDIALTGPVGLSDLPRTVRIADRSVRISLAPAQTLLDINMADAEQLTELLIRLGTAEERALELADLILDWRDNDDRPRARGGEAEAYGDGVGRPPENRAFLDVRELAHVRGITPDLLDCLAPYVTVLGGTPEPDAAAGAEPAMDGRRVALRAELIDERGAVDRLTGLALFRTGQRRPFEWVGYGDDRPPAGRCRAEQGD